MKNYFNRGTFALAVFLTSFSIQASEGNEKEAYNIDSCIRSSVNYSNQISDAIVESSEKCVERGEKCIEISEKCVTTISAGFRIIEAIDKLFYGKSMD